MYTYSDYKNRKDPLKDFEGLFFAFNNEQLKEGIAKVEATAENKVVNLGAGCFVLKSRVEAFETLMNNSKKRLKTLMKDYDFALSAFEYELANHEYCITWDVSETIDALGYTEEEILKSEVLTKALKTAVSKYNK